MKLGRPGIKVLCVNDGIMFDSCNAAAKNYNVSRSAVSRQINGRRRSVHGLYFVAISGAETKDELYRIRKMYISQVIKTEDLL